MKSPKLWSIAALILALALILVPAGMIAVVDPLFHYHAPLEGLQYPLTSQRYQNDGIVRHFSYDAMITGTSMSENFKTSQMDALFGVHAIKTCFSGGSFEEINRNLQQALDCNPELQLVLCVIDEWSLFAGKNMILASGEYPTYLYDDNPFNDVSYLLNREIFFDYTLEALRYTRSGGVTTSFDDYSAWDLGHPFLESPVSDVYTRPEQTETQVEFTQEEADRLVDTLESTLVRFAQEHPDVQFLYLFPPYSILNWDNHSRQGTLRRQVEAFRLASQVLLQAENIQLYAFYHDYETIENLANYVDSVHYDPDISALLLDRIAAGEGRLTQDMCDAYWAEILSHYECYDYDALYRP